jgi:hypothetical protein
MRLWMLLLDNGEFVVCRVLERTMMDERYDDG